MKSNEVIEKLNKNLILNRTDFLGEITLEVLPSDLREILNFFKTSSYRVLMDLTATDYINKTKRTKLIYWMHNPESLERVRIVVFVSRGESIASITDIFPGSAWYERELFDMFGIHFEGHVDLKRILMPDDWKGHPMLRDYALTEVPVEFKHGVQPKVPSEIIPKVNKLKVHHDYR